MVERENLIKILLDYKEFNQLNQKFSKFKEKFLCLAQKPRIQRSCEEEMTFQFILTIQC